MVELGDLPPDCIALILSQVLATPVDAGRCATFSVAFRAASDSDAVWRNFLPHDLDLIVSTSSPPPFGPSTRKKDVFLRLCTDPILIDSDRKSFALEKWSGKKCYMVGARDLSIVWGDIPSSLQWSSFHVSRFPEVAELIIVCWLEVRANMETRLLSADTYYSAYLIFKIVHKNSGIGNQAMGVSISSGSEVERRDICLDPDGRLRQQYQTSQAQSSRAVRSTEENIRQDQGDGWKEIYLGKFFVNNRPTGEVQVSLKKMTSGRWKSGLVIQGIELRPTRIISRQSSQSADRWTFAQRSAEMR
ncbi:hypothetical protein EUGRSUZ_H01357 [Eucalyptus grandis]|uniref:Uncharacterized protein n=3 Tax=Eucalyptus grandis TaxID=71139 RepID=A0ACC3JPQ3_EUCGR|nr:hypothetical protein EUGRSUZ_H01357 [Eucalyptus grandis]